VPLAILAQRVCEAGAGAAACNDRLRLADNSARGDASASPAQSPVKGALLAVVVALARQPRLRAVGRLGHDACAAKPHAGAPAGASDALTAASDGGGASLYGALAAARTGHVGAAAHELA